MSINTCKNDQAQRYKPMLKQTYRTKLIRLLKEELSLQGKPRILDLLADEIEKLNEECYPKNDHMRLWQVRVLVPAVEDKPIFGQTMENTMLKAVTLTVGTKEDVKMLGNKSKHCEAQEERLARIAFEAKAQGGVLSQAMAALLLGVRQSRVAAYLKNYQDRTGKIIPLRGIVHDMGKTTTHKKWVVELYERGYTEVQITWITSHSLWSVGRYLKVYKQICELCFSLNETPTAQKVSRILGISAHVVGEYLHIMSGLGKINWAGGRDWASHAKQAKVKGSNVFRAPTKYEDLFCNEGKAPETIIFTDKYSRKNNFAHV